jgi:tetratricopeptide (TPR) repeat protein
MKERIDPAVADKNLARTQREAGSLAEAEETADDAIRALEALWQEFGPSIGAAGPDVSAEERRLVAELADAYGVSGGIHRSRGNFERAIQAYDRGMDFEVHPARNSPGSYNLVQRLANRALLRPEQIGVPEWRVQEQDMREGLRQANDLLRTQVNGDRSKDPWAWADLLFVQLLRVVAPADDSDLDETWSKLHALMPRKFVYSSTRRAFEDLLKAMSTVADAQRSDAWKQVEHRLMRLVERLRAAEATGD